MVVIIIIAKDCLLNGQEQACSRISRLFVCSFVCHHAENGQIHTIMDVDCPLVITSIGETLFQTRPGKRNTWSTQSFTLGLRWVLSSSIHHLDMKSPVQGSCSRKSFDSTNLYNTYYQWVSIFLMVQVRYSDR